MAHHEFSPTTYYNTMGSHPPAFHVDAGDSIATTTVDARGFDHENAERAGRPNPQTGPFYVNGAEAGDTLVLQLHEVVPNRRMGWTTARLARTCWTSNTRRISTARWNWPRGTWT